MHGCFWHAHLGCPRATLPKRNRSFWKRKFAENRRRDRSVARRLSERGFHVVTIWECRVRAGQYDRSLDGLFAALGQTQKGQADQARRGPKRGGRLRARAQ